MRATSIALILSAASTLAACGGPNPTTRSAQTQSASTSALESPSPENESPSAGTAISFAGPECNKVTSQIYCDDCGLEAAEVQRPEAEACLISALLDPLTSAEKTSNDPTSMRNYRRARAADALGNQTGEASLRALQRAKREQLPDSVGRSVDRSLASRTANGR